MAALTQNCVHAHGEGAIQRTRLSRDLYQIAELVELCFGERLDATGRSVVREMKTIGRLGPLLWLLGLLDRLGVGLGQGYVWRVDRRLVGNVSLYQGGNHPTLGRGFLVANVAVHPDYRRRGIAVELMQRTLALARQKGGRWVALQVEADNAPALALYDRLHFERYETLHQWRAFRVSDDVSIDPLSTTIRPRRPGETAAEVDLIFNRARRGAMAWTRTISTADVRSDSLLAQIADTSYRERWVLPDPDHPNRLLGLLWVQASGLNQPRLTLFLDPDLRQSHARHALLHHAFTLSMLRGRTLRVETTGDDPIIEDFLRASGFRRMRSLIQMRRMLIGSRTL